jgi:hypothetical protein
MSIEHARALKIMSLRGVDEPTARGILFDLGQAGIHLKMTEPPVEPYTGDKAPEQTAEYAEVRARIQEAVRSGAKCAGCGLNAHPEFGGDGNYCRLCLPATKPTEYEEQHDA